MREPKQSAGIGEAVAKNDHRGKLGAAKGGCRHGQRKETKGQLAPTAD